jgi:hypothetical protein
MLQISMTLVPQLLTDEQKLRHMFLCQELFYEVRNDQNFLSRIITGLLLLPRNQTAVLSVRKPVLSTPEESKANQVEHHKHGGDLFDCEGIDHQEFVPPTQTVNQHCYWEVSQCLREQVCCKVRNDGRTRTY